LASTALSFGEIVTSQPLTLQSEGHKLFLADSTDPADVVRLAQQRWHRARRDRYSRIVLSRHSYLSGPTYVDATVLEDLGVPAGLSTVFELITLSERAEPPFPGAVDPTGLSRAFPRGLPHREEGRMVDFLLAVARRLCGAARFADSGVVLEPDPASAVDLTVYSNVWLDVEAGLTLARKVNPDFETAMNVAHFRVPAADDVDITLLNLTDVLGEDERRDLHRAAAAVDTKSTAGTPSLSGYALRAGLKPGGFVWVEIGGAPTPHALERLDWAAAGVISYTIGWVPPEPEGLLEEFPSERHIAQRTLAATLIDRVASAIHSCVGGVIADADGFAVSPTDLAR
jgi:hypothetical protein